MYKIENSYEKLMGVLLLIASQVMCLSPYEMQ